MISMIPLNTKKAFGDFGPGSKDLRFIIDKLRLRRLTGLLRVILDSCEGVIAVSQGDVVDGFEIFNNELLVRDQSGHNIANRYGMEPGRIEFYEVQQEALQILLGALQEESTQDPGSFFEFLPRIGQGKSLRETLDLSNSRSCLDGSSQ